MLPINAYIKKPSLILNGLIIRFFRMLEPLMSDESFLKMIYPYYIGKRLNLKHPKTFNEKLQWLKLYYRNPLYHTLVDKASAKEWVAHSIGDQFVIPTIAEWNSVEDIDYDILPDSFVLKTTHGGGGNGVIICKDKKALDKDSAARKLSRNMKEDIASYFKEWPYGGMNKKIIAEEMISLSDGKELMDFKLLCFNGKVRCLFVGSNRFQHGGVHTTYYDRNWNRLPFERSNQAEKDGIQKPAHYELMVKLAEILAKDIPFVRVDFYEANGNVYFGEMTFFPGSGFLAFNPDKWDKIIGSWLTLPKRNN